jgi:hypothetical protein
MPFVYRQVSWISTEDNCRLLCYIVQKTKKMKEDKNDTIIHAKNGHDLLIRLNW